MIWRAVNSISPGKRAARAPSTAAPFGYVIFLKFSCGMAAKAVGGTACFPQELAREQSSQDRPQAVRPAETRAVNARACGAGPRAIREPLTPSRRRSWAEGWPPLELVSNSSFSPWLASLDAISSFPSSETPARLTVDIKVWAERALGVGWGKPRMSFLARGGTCIPW